MRRGLAGFMVGCTLLVMLGTLGTPAPAGATVEERLQLTDLVNQAREARGLHGLGWSKDLWSLARKHSIEMCASGDLYHSRNLSVRLSFANWSTYGENVGVGVDVRGLFDAFMASDAHRANILDRSFRKVGIGFAHDENGILWVTMIFYG